MSTPESQIPEEMLSAFLDGELTPDESAQVSAALEQDESLQTLLAELEQIRAEIQRLPRHALSKDFASKIAATCIQHPPAVQPANQSSMQWLWITGIAATAAGILIAISAIDWGSTSIPMASTRTVEESTGPADPARNEELLTQQSRGATTFSASPLIAADDNGVEMSENHNAGTAAPELAPAPKLAVADDAPANAAADGVVGDSAMENLATAGSVASFGIRNPEPQALWAKAGGSQGFDALVRVKTSATLADSKWQALPLTEDDSMTTLAARHLNRGGRSGKAEVQLFVTEGTQTQIEAAFRDLQAEPVSVQFFSAETNARTIGLPETYAKATQPIRRQRAAMSYQNVARQATREPAANSRSRLADQEAETITKLKQADKLTPASVAVEPESVAPATDNIAFGGRRYRVLLMVEPTDGKRKASANATKLE